MREQGDASPKSGNDAQSSGRRYLRNRVHGSEADMCPEKNMMKNGAWKALPFNINWHYIA
jgi:hypothetical protein